MSTSEREPTLLEQGWSLFFASTSAASREPAMRIAIRLVESDPFQLAGVALLVRLAIAAGRKGAAAVAAPKLVEAYVRRGDLPAATAAAVLADRAGADGKAARASIAKAFGQGSSRLADVSPAPPPLPSTPEANPALEALAGEDLLDRGEATLRDFVDATDPLAAGKVPSLPLFSQLAPKALERLLTALTVRDLDMNGVAIEQGSEGREAFVVVRGTLRAERAASADEGEPTLLAVLGPGAIFGEMALVSSAPRAAAVIAQEPTTLLVVARDALEAIAVDEPAIGRELGSYCRSRMLANLVRTSALLRAIPSADREGVIALFDTKSFGEGEVLFEEGSEPEGLYLVASGGVRVTTHDPAGGEDIVVADLGPGDVVGEISIVLRRPATATVSTAFPTIALELSRERFQEAIRRHPAVLTELYALATARQDELHSVVAQEALDVEDVVLL
ncbi:MAG: cyclic nucleotide-binding domain-containing protein [Sandaracinaceae bacterium]|nr:cyclic nucleotide-binding domain-containing protein [Sandaracinaceae bacterium]